MMNKRTAEEVAASIRKDMFISNENAYDLINLAGMESDLEIIADADFGWTAYESALIGLTSKAAEKLGVNIDWHEEFLVVAREAYKAAGMEKSDEEIMNDYYNNNLEKVSEGLWYNNGNEDDEWIYNTTTKQLVKE